MQVHEKVTRAMVAEEAGVELSIADFALGSASAKPLSLDQSMGDAEGEFTLQDLVADNTTEAAFAGAEVETILPLLEKLDVRQQKILRMRYSENRTSNDIGDELGLSGSRVQQIEVQAIRCLRRQLIMSPRRSTGYLAAA